MTYTRKFNVAPPSVPAPRPSTFSVAISFSSAQPRSGQRAGRAEVFLCVSTCLPLCLTPYIRTALSRPRSQLSSRLPTSLRSPGVACWARSAGRGSPPPVCTLLSLVKAQQPQSVGADLVRRLALVRQRLGHEVLGADTAAPVGVDLPRSGRRHQKSSFRAADPKRRAKSGCSQLGKKGPPSYRLRDAHAEAERVRRRLVGVDRLVLL